MTLLPLKQARLALIDQISAGDYCRARDHDCGACSCDEIWQFMQRCWGLAEEPAPVVPERDFSGPGPVCGEVVEMVGGRGSCLQPPPHVHGSPGAGVDKGEQERCRGAVEGFDHGNPTTYQCHSNIPCSDHPEEEQTRHAPYPPSTPNSNVRYKNRGESK